MANAFYTQFKVDCLSGAINLLTADVRLTAVNLDAGYTFSAAHTTLSQVPSGTRVATSASLANKTVTGAVFDADDVTLASVAAISGGGDIDAYILHVAGESGRLICYIDTGVNLEVIPNGSNIVVRFDSGANKIFKL